MKGPLEGHIGLRQPLPRTGVQSVTGLQDGRQPGRVTRSDDRAAKHGAFGRLRVRQGRRQDGRRTGARLAPEQAQSLCERGHAPVLPAAGPRWGA